MIAELAELLKSFPGAANCSRCFTHILNLAAKSVLRQFDLPKGKADAAASEAAKELARLSENLEVEELRSLLSEFENVDKDLGDDPSEDDDLEGWVDEMAELSDEEREEIDEGAVPVCMMLVKVSGHVKNCD